MSRTRTTAAGLAALALVLPAAAAAKQPAAHGHGHDSAKPHPVSYVLKGTWSAGDASVVVTSGNAHVRRAHLIGKKVALDLSAARFTVADTDGDGAFSAADVKDGDSVLVQARAPRVLPDGATLAVRRVVDRTNPPVDDGLDAPEAPAAD